MLIKEYTEQHTNSETAEYLQERFVEHGICTKEDWDLTTKEGYWDAMLDAMEESMTSGAAFGGPLSGADTNAALNATGLVGIDSLLDGGTEKKKKKKKIEV